MEFPVGGGPLKAPSTVHSVGAEWSPALGASSRYHLRIAYSTQTDYTGVRLDPLQFGFPIKLYFTDEIRLDLEPILSFLQIAYLSSDWHSLLMLSSGAELRFNLFFDRFYAGFSPAGINVRYFGVHMPNPSDSYGHERAFSDSAIDYRLHTLIGFNY